MAAPIPPPPEDQKAFLQLVVNEVAQGEVMVVLRPGDILIGESDLGAAGLKGLEGARRESQEGRTMISLASLSPRLRYVFQDADLVLRISADPSMLGTTTINLASARPPGLSEASDRSLFINYAGWLEDGRRPTGFAESGLSLGKGRVFYTSGTAHSDGRMVRNMTSFTLDLPSRLLRAVIGDSVLGTEDLLGGSLFITGINVGTNYTVDPYFHRFPSLGFSGAATTPSTVEVYVNGALVRRQELAPGPFSVQNLPVTVGRGETRVVVRDAFGSQTTLGSSYYLGQGVLAAGLTEKNLAVGARPVTPGLGGLDYQGGALLGTYRRGITRWLTAGVRAEGTPELASGGANVALALPYGEAGASLGASRQGEQTGTALAGYYSYTGRGLNLGLAVRAPSARYANLTTPAEMDRPVTEGRATIGTSIGGLLTVSLQGQQGRWRDGGSDRRLSFIANMPIGRAFNLFANGSRSWDRHGQRVTDLFAGVSWAPAARTTVLAAASGHGDANGQVGSARAEIQHAVPLGPGVGYTLLSDVGRESKLLMAEGRAQGAHGRIEAQVQRSAGVTSSVVRLSGGIIAMGGDLFLTRPVDSSFALIQVPGVAGVRGYQSNQPVGRTNAQGNLLIPNLLPYYDNRLGINDKDIPIAFDVGAIEMTIAPPYRGGAVVRFPVRRILSVTGQAVVLLGGAKVVPAFGQITVMVGKKAAISPINAEGTFYLEDVPSGRHMAEIEFGKGTCTFLLQVPPSAQPVADVGTVTCTGRPAAE
jgi:outer membrane usher protein